WDRGSAKLLASLGFAALATTSSGFAATFGQLDGSTTRNQALASAAEIASVVDLPVSADLEDCFASDPAGVAETVRLAVEAGGALAARSRLPPAGPTSRSMTGLWPPSESPRLPRPRTAGPFTSC